MVQKLRERSQGEGGFTLVELLVVMLILGLLAAIAIPSFFNQREKAKDADAKAVVRTAQTAMETYATGNGGAYTGVAATRSCRASRPTLNDANLGRCRAAATTYTVTVTSEAATGERVQHHAATATATTDARLREHRERAARLAGQDGCPTGGNWGD